MFLSDSNPNPLSSQTTPTHVPPTIQTHKNASYTTTLSIDHNTLREAQNQNIISRQTQPSPQELLSRFSHVSDTYQSTPNPSTPFFISQSSTVYVAPIGQNLATTSQNYQSTFGTNMYESLSSSFHTQLNQASFLVNDHPTLTRAKTEKSKPKSFIVHSEPTTTKQTLAQSEWFQAMRTEYDSLIKNGTWVLAALPPDRKLI